MQKLAASSLAEPSSLVVQFPQPTLQLIYDTAPIGLAFLSPDCRYLQINQRLTDICGISVEDHLGRSEQYECCYGHAYLRLIVLLRAAQMVFDRNAANVGQALVDLQIAAIGRKEGQPDRRGVVDELQRRLRKLYDRRRWLARLLAASFCMNILKD